LTENPLAQQASHPEKLSISALLGLAPTYGPAPIAIFSRETLPFCLVNRTVASNCQRALPVARPSHRRITRDDGEECTKEKDQYHISKHKALRA